VSIPQHGIYTCICIRIYIHIHICHTWYCVIRAQIVWCIDGMVHMACRTCYVRHAMPHVHHAFAATTHSSWHAFQVAATRHRKCVCRNSIAHASASTTYSKYVRHHHLDHITKTIRRIRDKIVSPADFSSDSETGGNGSDKSSSDSNNNTESNEE